MNAAAGQLAALGVAVTVPAIGAVLARVGPLAPVARIVGIVSGVVSALAALVLVAMWQAHDGSPTAWGDSLAGGSLVFIDGLTAMAVPYVALVFLAITVAAPRRTLDSESVPRLLAGSAGTIALMGTAHPVALVILWVVTALPTWSGTRSAQGGGPAARVYALAMAAATAFLAVGVVLLVRDPPWQPGSGPVGNVGGWLVAIAVMMRKGIVPFHSWYPALYSGGAFGAALAATMPHIAAATAIRLLVGHAGGVSAELVFLAQAALVTTAYAAALAVVQRDLRGLVGTLALSQSSLVLAGLAGTLPTELCGALAVWISSGLSLTGMGLVAWSIESRAGPVSLETLQGRAADAPTLSGFFLLFGLASLGVPGTLSFVADDLIVSGSLDDRLHAGLLVIAGTVFAGIAVLRGWVRVFGGPAPAHRPPHPILPRERLVFTSLMVVLLVLGLWPGPLVHSLEQIAGSLVAQRGSDTPLPAGNDHPHR
ncbi:MAG: hypothetical protein EBR86_04740 [Planctomycetia bacterium]|nr:hypothetical protein [Planctomycetia bacterium]